MALTKISGNVVQQNNFTLSGVVTATSFTGDLTGNVTGTATTATNLSDGANITTGTISNDRLPATITKNLTGDVTGNLTGNVTGNLTGNVTGNLTGNVTGNVSSSGANTLGSLTVTNDATVGGALTVTGNLTVNGTTTTIDTVVTAIDSIAVDGDITAGGNLNITGVSTFGDNVDLGDNDKLRFGAGYDLEIYSDGTNGIIKDTNTSGGDLRLLSDVVKLMNSDGTKVSFKGIEDGAAELYYNNSKKFETTSNGIQISGDQVLNGHLDMRDSDRIRLGASDDLQIFHNGSANYIDNTSDFYVRVNGSETAIYATANGKVALNYDGNNRFETTLNGAKVTGDLNVTGILTVGQSSVTIDGTNNKITTPKLDYAGISSSISDTAVDIFIYDTSKDSDGGAWRKRTQHTSWYNETLNTTTRGSRREFPAVAVIVAEAQKLTIYDGDDPDLPMWMVYESGGTWNTTNNVIFSGMGDLTSVTALNGEIVFGAGQNYGVVIQNFIEDRGTLQHISTFRYLYPSSISRRNSGDGSGPEKIPYTSYTLVNANINDVAMTVLPNAPIDSATGLPVPTIAVATDGGVSVIRDDGIVVDTISNNGTYTIARSVEWSSNNDLLFVMGDSGGGLDYFHTYDGFNTSDNTITIDTKTGSTKNVRSMFRKSSVALAYGVHPFEAFTVQGSSVSPDYSKLHVISKNDAYEYAIRSPQGLTHISENPDSSGSLVSYATTSYATGWLHGDIKGAFLSDTDATSAGSNLVINGTFDSTSNWTLSGTGAFSISSGTLNGDGTAGDSFAQQAVSPAVVEQGKTYTVKVTVTHTSGNLYARVANSPYSSNIGSTATHSVSLTAGSVPTETVLFYSSGWSGTIDNVEVILEDQDRSVNNNGLQVFGTIDRDPVVTGAELVAYGGFNGSNYLRQPHNADLNVGTGDFYVMCWVKGNQLMLWHRVDSGSLDMRCEFPTSGGNANKPRFLFNNGGVTISFYATTAFDTTTWHHCVWVKRGARGGELYIDGVLNNSATAGSDLSLNGTNSTFSIGNRADSPTEAFNGYVSLFRFGASAPSDEQIKKIYEDEKMLFQENAACTLYGSSDAVTALAYDDSTNLLYAGTSSGRSDFQGLRRINNTTTAVTTAMSASNGLVAEQ